MPLIRTSDGVRLQHDWQPGRIGSAYRQPQSCQGEGATAIQVALLHKPRRTLEKPRPVPVLDTLEKLVDFLRT